MSTPPQSDRKRRGRILWILAIALVYALPLLTLDGAIDMFIKLGDIEGESTDAKHKDEIDVLAWSWGMSQSGSFKTGGGGGAGKANVQDFSFTKYVDKASAKLLETCANGTHHDEAEIVLRDTSNAGEYYKVTFKDLIITSVDHGGTDEQDRLTEKVGINFDFFEVAYFITDPTTGDPLEETSIFWTVTADAGGAGSNLQPNTAPTITDVPDQTTTEDPVAPLVVSFTVDDTESAAGALELTRGSNNQSLVPAANIVLGGSGTSRTATITPAPDAVGTATITLIVSDGNLSAQDTFELTIDPVNDPPSVAPVSDQVTGESMPLDINVTVSDIDSDLLTVTVSATSSNQLVLGDADISHSGTGATRTVTLAPAAGSEAGMTTITLTATDSDSATSPPVTFELTVNSASSTITDIFLATDTLPENSPTDTSLGPLDAIPPGPGGPVDYTLTNDAGGRFKIGGALNNELLVADGSLLDVESSATHLVVVRATDPAPGGGSFSKPFTINLTNVNEPPLITAPPAQDPVDQQVDAPLTGISIDDPDSGTADITVTVSATAGTLVLDDFGVLAGTVTGNNTASLSVTAPLADINSVLAAPFGLLYQSDPGFLATDTITITTDDLGNSGSPGTQTDSLNTTIEVTLSLFEQWRQANFTAAELADPAVSGAHGNGDLDSLFNLGEYGAGSGPKDGTDGPDQFETVEVPLGGSIYPGVRFPRRISDPNLTIEVQIATDIRNWTTGGASTVEHTVAPIDADFELATIRSLVPLGAEGTQQLRVRFTLDGP